MYRLIRQVAQRFEEQAPKECLIGAKVATVSAIVACTGGAVAFGVDPSIGAPVVVVGILGGFGGMAIYFLGFFKNAAKNREDTRSARERYENSRQPWE